MAQSEGEVKNDFGWNDDAFIEAFNRQISAYAEVNDLGSDDKVAEHLAQHHGFKPPNTAQDEVQDNGAWDGWNGDEEDEEEEEEEEEEEDEFRPPRLPKGFPALDELQRSGDDDDAELANLLLAWYYAGYYTAKYKYSKSRGTNKSKRSTKNR
jgi:hypothetical protein